MKSGKKQPQADKGEQIRELPLFSVIVLTYQQRHLLNDCLASIFMQTYPNIELVICDDCSADFEVDEVKQYIEEHRSENLKNVVVYQQKCNVGIVQNSQTGVDLSSGTYFKLHAGDDMLYAEGILDMIAGQFAGKEVQIIAGRSVACQYDGDETEHYYPSATAVSNMKNADAQRQFELLGTQSWCEFVHGPAVFWRRSFFDQIGGFDLTYTYASEWPMWLKITGNGQKITISEELVTIYRYGGVSNDAKSMAMAFGNTHYDEIIRGLQEEALPKFEQAGNRKKIIRCKHAVRSVQLRKDIEQSWGDWGMCQQLLWRIRNFDFLFLAWLYRYRETGISLGGRSHLIVMGICVLLYAFNIQIYPGVSCRGLWSWGFVLTACLLLLKCAWVVCIKAMNLLPRLIRKG